MFKRCNSCKVSWETVQDFLDDPDTAIIGYQAHFEDIGQGLFLFNHLAEGCCTTMALPVSDFFGLCEGKAYIEIKTGSPECTGGCLDIDNLEACSAFCRFAHVRELAQRIRKWPKARQRARL
jgi:hypothetical protein